MDFTAEICSEALIMIEDLLTNYKKVLNLLRVPSPNRYASASFDVGLHAPGGNGKMFLIRLILPVIRSKNDIALALGLSGIAATLLSGERTARLVSTRLAFIFTINKAHGQSLELCGLDQWGGIKKVNPLMRALCRAWSKNPVPRLLLVITDVTCEKKGFMPKKQKSKIPESSGESAHSPIWSVTRRQRTELSPRRDDEIGSTQSFSSRTVTTTERVQMIPLPVNLDVPVDVLTPTGRSERFLATTKITNESHSLPVIGGITISGAPLYTGLYIVPKTTKTKNVRTMMTTTTTTTYSVIEINDSEEELKVETEEKTVPESTRITLDFPMDYEVVDFEDLLAASPAEEKEHLYVVVGKKDSPTRTTDAADYVVKMIDIDLPSSESKDSPSIERISDAEIEGLMTEVEEGYSDRHDYDAYEGTIASTSRSSEIDQEPIHRYVTVYHNGVSSEKPAPEEERISKEISTVVAKLSGAYKRASIEGEHTIYTDARTGQTLQEETQSEYRQIGESPRRLKSTYTVRFSDPFRIEADDYSWTREENQPEIMFQKEKKDQIDTLDEWQKEKEQQTQRKEKETEITEEKRQKEPTIAGKIITGLFKKEEAYPDYPVTEAYEGPVDSTYRTPDVEMVTVYHSGRSDEFVSTEEKKPSIDVGEIFTDAAQALGAKITGLFKRGPAYLDYPTSGPYDGPLATIYLALDIEEEPLEQHVNVYHSGRSDVLVPIEEGERITDENINGFSRPIDAKLSVLLRGKTIPSDYPISEKCVGPLSLLLFSRDVEGLPLQECVNIYNSGRSDLQPEELPFQFSIRHDEISDRNAESQLYSSSRGVDLHDRTFSYNEVKPSVSPLTSTYAGSEYRIYRPLEPLIVPSRAEQKTTDYDISISSRIASGRSLPIGIAHPVPKVSEISGCRRYDEISEFRGSKIIPTHRDFDYHRKTREVDYWIGRRSERQSKPCRDLTADIGIDLASDADWERNNAFETHPLESVDKRQSGHDFSAYPSKTEAQKVHSTSNLHWTTVSETTSVSYKKRISIERRRPHPTSPSHLATYRRQYRPPPPPAEVSAYARYDRAVFESSTLPRSYAGVAIEGDLRTQRVRYEASSLPSTYYSGTETRIQRNPVRYDLPRPSSPPRYEYWTGERNNWTVEGSPRQSCIVDQNGHSVFDDRYMRQSKQEALRYQKSNLEEIPIISLIKDLPMIEDGADECSCATVSPATRIKTQDLSPGEHSRPCRSAPLRRARQRIRNLCTML
ncbi:unnamed protein product [Onchocerca ochengi]|uniref:ATP-dependent DNA helicase n=1 Tax=Onchocerca ochengi TaxID=42157 RepID=A0A182EDL0_ONCOC|nr:unnamed protein product [Onchocerca ochengi]